MAYSFLTIGTTSFLKRLTEKYKHIPFIFMKNNENTLVYYEDTKKRSIFSAGKRYDILHTYKPLIQQGFVAMQHIPVAKEVAPVLEEKFPLILDELKQAEGVQSIRILKQLKKYEYNIFTVWKNEKKYTIWNENNKQSDHQLGRLIRHPAYFANRSFTNFYMMLKEDEK